jgi:hypothetical protein
MELQEWFITHPWAYYLYWILGIIFLIIIYKLPTQSYPSKKWIIRLPHSLSGSVETKQGKEKAPKG